MDTRQAEMLLRRLKAGWPAFYADKDRERINLLIETFRPYSYETAQRAVNRLLSESKTYPSISELRQALGALERKIEASESVCKYCDGTYWIFVDNETPGTVIRCKCAPIPLN